MVRIFGKVEVPEIQQQWFGKDEILLAQVGQKTSTQP